MSQAHGPPAGVLAAVMVISVNLCPGELMPMCPHARCSWDGLTHLKIPSFEGSLLVLPISQ